MKRSSDRILTTHTGSLPRPDDLKEMIFAREEGRVDEAGLAARVSEAVRDAVAKQVQAGIDVVSDGEMGRIGMHYIKDRMNGFGGPSRGLGDDAVDERFSDETRMWLPADLREYPEVAMLAVGATEGAQRMTTPACSSEITPRDTEAVGREIADLEAALEATPAAQAFLTVSSPGTVAQICFNHYYDSHESYVFAIADAMKPEWKAIVDAGLLLQVDAPDLPMQRHLHFKDASFDEYHATMETNVEALSRALRDLPADRVRFHVCWGNYPGTHHHDVELKEIMDLVLSVRAGAISFPAANPRHEHEWSVWRDVDLPDETILIPGVIDSLTNFVEHPELVAERIGRFVDIVGPERVMAGTDCGFGTFVGLSPVQPRVAYVKLAALSEGARLASGRLSSGVA
jgi:5-methyltetrahydropteroyltriglutamate--homocysteine methyltransferase